MIGIKLIRQHLMLRGSKYVLGPFELNSSTQSKTMGFNFYKYIKTPRKTKEVSILCAAVNVFRSAVKA